MAFLSGFYVTSYRVLYVAPRYFGGINVDLLCLALPFLPVHHDKHFSCLFLENYCI